MSSARITSVGTVHQLDGKAQPDEVFTSSDAKDTEKLARTIQKLLKENAELKRRWNPPVLVFEDQAVGASGTAIRLAHGFKGRVRWSLVGWRSSGTSAPILKEDLTNTTENTLVLLSYVTGTATIRVEEAG